MRVRQGTIDVHAEELGGGEPVVMIHSSDMSSRQWRGLARAVVVAVARALGRAVHIVGHSYGGMLALHAARGLGADLVRSIAVYEPVAWGVAGGDPLVRADLQRFGDRFFAPDYGG